MFILLEWQMPVETFLPLIFHQLHQIGVDRRITYNFSHLTHKMAHGHTWGLLPACSPKGEEHIRKLLCRNRLRGLSWKGTSQSRLFATASKQPACPQSGHEPYFCCTIGHASEEAIRHYIANQG